MKNKLLNLLNKQIVYLLSILGFSLAANQCVAQYGAPVNDYLIKGTVLTNYNKPIKDIKVKSNFDSTYTDSAGNFILNTYVRWGAKSYKVDFTDTNKTEKYFYKDTILFTPPNEQKNLFIKLQNKEK